MLVYTCTPEDANVEDVRVGLGTSPAGTCDSGGAWVQLAVVATEGELTLEQAIADDPGIVAEPFAAGFILVGMAWAIGRGVRALLSMIGT